MSLFLTPINTWKMVSYWAGAMGQTQKVDTFLLWLIACMIAPQFPIANMYSAYLKDSMLGLQRSICHALVPPPPPPQLPEPPTHYFPPPLPQLTLAPAPKLVTGSAERWCDELQVLLRLYNMRGEEYLPVIWNTVAPLFIERSRAVMESEC